jgi:uncharacterized membrane protein YhaH (DUF805 family)
MNFGDSIKSGFNRYFDFSTRSSRSEYWWWYLFNMISTYAFVFLGGALVNMGFEAGALLFGLWGLAMLIPTLAVAVRRLHDTDRSGWWLLIGLVPLIGWIVLIIWYVSRGTEGDNEYGPDPLILQE